MAQFRSKPVVIEATRWLTDGDHPAVILKVTSSNEPYHVVLGAQGWSNVYEGDWIIKEPLGDGYYPCKPTVFDAKYDPA